MFSSKKTILHLIKKNVPRCFHSKKIVFCIVKRVSPCFHSIRDRLQIMIKLANKCLVICRCPFHANDFWRREKNFNSNFSLARMIFDKEKMTSTAILLLARMKSTIVLEVHGCIYIKWKWDWWTFYCSVDVFILSENGINDHSTCRVKMRSTLLLQGPGCIYMEWKWDWHSF